MFLGSGGFALPSLRAVAESPLTDVVAVVTARPRPVGRGGRVRPSPVGAAAERLGLSVLTPVRLRDPESLGRIRELRPQLLVLADYGQIVPRALLELPALGALNLHPSLLPRHRGATPIPATILAGDAETGVTLMRMDEGLDTGPIVAQRSVALDGSEIAPELESRLAEVAAALLLEALPSWLDGTVRAVPQAVVGDGASTTRPLRREDGRLEPTRSAADLERQVRAYQPWPGSYLETPLGRVVVWRAAALPAHVLPITAHHAGMLVAGPPGHPLCLVVSDGFLDLREVQPAGGRRMEGAELLRGRPTLAVARISADTPGRGLG